MNRKSKWRKRAAASLAACMLLHSEAFAAEVLPQITTALSLAQNDVAANSGTIKLLLQQCLEALEEGDPLAVTLESVICLLDTGTADGNSVVVLLESAAEMSGGAAGDDTGVQEESAAAGEDAEVQEEGADAGEDAEVQEEGADAGEDAEVQDEGGDAAENVEVQDAQNAGAAAGNTDAKPLTYAEDDLFVSEFGLPVYDVSYFLKTLYDETVLVDVPGDWGNNASGGRALTSYSPVNGSGAISPAAGTLTVSYFPMEDADVTGAFDTYEKNIRDMSVTTGLVSEDATAASLPARKIEFTMSVGANQFTCETICFAYEQTIYAIELMQGQQTTYDYFPAYKQVVNSAEVGTAETIAQALQQQSEAPPQGDIPAQSEAPPQTESEAPPQSESTAQSEAPPQTEGETPQSESPAQSELPPQGEAAFAGDMGSFQYQINGRTYQFPTDVRSLQAEDLQLDRSLQLPYDFSSDADMISGDSWTELANTQYYYFENSQYKEMIGLTNMSGYPVMAADGKVTALIDTKGTYMDLMLPGDVCVGGAEQDILRGFPEFAQVSRDGLASFRGNELLYACNVRDDGCTGYVLIRNDAPYYSAVSIICENGVIKEISFECLGSVRAEGVFL